MIALPGRRECAIVAAIGALPGVTVPAPGFGSSDCRVCPAHLLLLPEDLEPESIARALGATILDLNAHADGLDHS